MNLPNKLTIFRVILIPFFVVFIMVPYLYEECYGTYVAFAIFVIASLTDSLDGKIARKYNLVTNFGKFMDPLADKLLVCSALICLIYTGQIAAWIVIVIIAREFIISAFRLIAAEKGVVIAANAWGKVKTAVSMVMICACLLKLPFEWYGPLCDGLIYASLIMTVISLVTYISQNTGVLKDTD